MSNGRPAISRRLIVSLGFVLTAIMPGVSNAKIPSMQLSTFPSAVLGSASGAAGECRVVLHDISDTPLYAVPVSLDLSETSFRLFSEADPGATVNCAARTVTKLTDLYGMVVFHPRFGGSDPSGQVIVAWDGLALVRTPGRSTDLDGSDGATGLSDLTAFAESFASGLPSPALNFDDSPSDVPDLADFSLFTQEFALAMQSSYCP